MKANKQKIYVIMQSKINTLSTKGRISVIHWPSINLLQNIRMNGALLKVMNILYQLHSNHKTYCITQLLQNLKILFLHSSVSWYEHVKGIIWVAHTPAALLEANLSCEVLKSIMIDWTKTMRAPYDHVSNTSNLTFPYLFINKIFHRWTTYCGILTSVWTCCAYIKQMEGVRLWWSGNARV